MIETIAVECGACNTTQEARPLRDGSPAQPKGWHRLAGVLWCPRCWKDNYALRSIELPVASVVEGYASEGGGAWSQEACASGWKAFRAALRLSSRQAAQYSNLVLAECFAADRSPLEAKPRSTSAEDFTNGFMPSVKLPKMEYPETYQLGRERFPELDSQSLGSLRQKAQAKYREQRWDLRVTGKESLSTYRNGLPVPIPGNAARLEVSHHHQEDVTEDERKEGRGQVFVRLRLAGSRFTLRLRSGAGDKQGHHSFWRKIAALEKIDADQALQGEVKIYERRVADANGRNGGTIRAEAGAPRQATRVMVSIAVWLPKEKSERLPVTVRVVTNPERLWSVFVGDNAERAWNLNEEQARRWVIARRQRQHKLSEDAKFERRSRVRGTNVKPADLASARQRISQTYQKRLDDWAHKASRMLANFAARSHASKVVYNDADKSWCPGLPWFKLQTLLADKLGRFGIEFVHERTSDEPTPE